MKHSLWYLPPRFKTVGATRGTLLPSRGNTSWSWTCAPRWPGPGAPSISHSGEAVTGHCNGGCFLTLGSQRSAECGGGGQSEPGCCSPPAQMDYLLPSDHSSSVPAGSLSPSDCLVFSTLLLPLRGLHPSAVQSSCIPPAPEGCAPLQWLWFRGGLTKQLPGPAAQAPTERLPEIHGERQVG